MVPRRRVMVVIASAIVLLTSSVATFSVISHKPSHPPISIVGDLSFIQENGIVQGDGSPQDPYVIEGWDIKAPSNGSGIYIRDTSAHLLVRNVDIHSNDSAWFGVCLEYAKNVTFKNVKMTGNWNGIRMDYCRDVTIERCDASSNLYGGIEISRSENISVTESRAADNHLHNLEVWSTNTCNISGNEFRPGDEKWRAWDNLVDLRQSPNATFSFNVMNGCYLQISNCTSCNLAQNEFSDTCIWFAESSSGAFMENEMTHGSYLDGNYTGFTFDRDYPPGPPGV